MHKYFPETRSPARFLFELVERHGVLFKCKGNFLMRKLAERRLVDEEQR